MITVTMVVGKSDFPLRVANITQLNRLHTAPARMAIQNRGSDR